MKYQEDNRSNSLLEELFSHRSQGVPAGYVPEQERNFDAGFTPSQTPRKFVRKEQIDGTWYNVYQG